MSRIQQYSGSRAFKKLAKEYGFEYAEADLQGTKNPLMIIGKVGAPEAANVLMKYAALSPAERKAARLRLRQLNEDAFARDKFFSQDPAKMFDAGVKGLPANVRKAVLLWVKKNGTVKISAARDRVVFVDVQKAPESRIDAIYKLKPETWKTFVSGRGHEIAWIKPKAVKGSPLSVILSKKTF